MANRCTLHVNHLTHFKDWLNFEGIAHRPGKGEYQVLQVEVPEKGWQVIYRRDDMPEHYTVPEPLIGMVRQFLAELKERRIKEA